jgi:hypothetical protein
MESWLSSRTRPVSLNPLQSITGQNLLKELRLHFLPKNFHYFLLFAGDHEERLHHIWSRTVGKTIFIHPCADFGIVPYRFNNRARVIHLLDSTTGEEACHHVLAILCDRSSDKNPFNTAGAGL